MQPHRNLNAPSLLQPLAKYNGLFFSVQAFVFFLLRPIGVAVTCQNERAQTEAVCQEHKIACMESIRTLLTSVA